MFIHSKTEFMFSQYHWNRSYLLKLELAQQSILAAICVVIPDITTGGNSELCIFECARWEKEARPETQSPLQKNICLLMETSFPSNERESKAGDVGVASHCFQEKLQSSCKVQHSDPDLSFFWFFPLTSQNRNQKQIVWCCSHFLFTADGFLQDRWFP